MGIVGRSVLIAGLSTMSDSDERIPGHFSEHWHIPRRPIIPYITLYIAVSISFSIFFSV